MHGHLTIRREQDADGAAVRNLNLLAFGRESEADLVDLLHRACSQRVSLVAVASDGAGENGDAAESILGHLMLSPVVIDGGSSSLRGMGIGPMAVHPDHQRQGVGRALMRQLDTLAREAGWPFVVVLGHPDFYGRFGYVPASRHGIRCTYDVPDEVFRILVLNERLVGGIHGTVRYHTAFEMV